MNLPFRPPVSVAPARDLVIRGGVALVEGALVAADLRIANGHLDALDPVDAGNATLVDAEGLLVLPGAIDIHGDGFERLWHPRPGVSVPIDVALLEADRHYAANGITTAYHAITWSWEGGDRGAEAAETVIAGLERVRPHLAVDTRAHLRHETFNLAAEVTIIDWLMTGRLDALAFNDHMAGTIKQRHRPDKLAVMLQRSRLSAEAFDRLIETTYARADEVPGSIARLAGAAHAAGIPMLSHDDISPDTRAAYRALGCTIAEFPVNEETARAAAAANEPIVFGSPNVLRGGSHTGCPAASEMVAAGLCTVLASDYYCPALPLAPFRLARDGVCDLASGWALVSSGPAAALGLDDRGALKPGLRADVVLVEDRGALPPRIVATIVAGRLVHCIDADRRITA